MKEFFREGACRPNDIRQTPEQKAALRERSYDQTILAGFQKMVNLVGLCILVMISCHIESHLVWFLNSKPNMVIGYV